MVKPARLRAIGHLVEAEDESQKWPQLHAAIRAARQAFQAGGAIEQTLTPDKILLGVDSLFLSYYISPNSIRLYYDFDGGWTGEIPHPVAGADGYVLDSASLALVDGSLCAGYVYWVLRFDTSGGFTYY